MVEEEEDEEPVPVTVRWPFIVTVAVVAGVVDTVLETGVATAGELILDEVLDEQVMTTFDGDIDDNEDDDSEEDEERLAAAVVVVMAEVVARAEATVVVTVVDERVLLRLQLLLLTKLLFTKCAG